MSNPCDSCRKKLYCSKPCAAKKREGYRANSFLKAFKGLKGSNTNIASMDDFKKAFSKDQGEN